MGRLMKAATVHPFFEQVIDAVKRDNISPDEFRILKDEESWEDTLIEEREIGREEGHQRGLAEGQRQIEAIVRSLISEGLSN